MEERQELPLQFSCEVNQEIPAGEQIELRKWRVHHDILRREDHHFPNLLRDSISKLFLGEIALETLRRDVRGDGRRIQGLARAVNGVFVNIGREYLHADLATQFQATDALRDGNGNRIGLFSR